MTSPLTPADVLREARRPRLTRKQWEALGSLMLPEELGGRRQLHPKTAEKLIALGYVEAKERLLRGRFPVRIVEHIQTLMGNIAYCEWAAKPDRAISLAQQSEATG